MGSPPGQTQLRYPSPIRSASYSEGTSSRRTGWDEDLAPAPPHLASNESWTAGVNQSTDLAPRPKTAAPTSSAATKFPGPPMPQSIESGSSAGQRMGWRCRTSAVGWIGVAWDSGHSHGEISGPASPIQPQQPSTPPTSENPQGNNSISQAFEQFSIEVEKGSPGSNSASGKQLTVGSQLDLGRALSQAASINSVDTNAIHPFHST